jgi:hypothetical protein
MLSHHCFRKKLGSIAPTLAAQDLVVFAELDLIVINGLAQVICHAVALQKRL